FRDGHPQRVFRAADGLVRGDPHVDLAADGGQLGEFPAGLFDVLQAVGGPDQLPDAADGLVGVPRRVGVHPDRPARAEGLAHRGDPLDVLARALPWLGDLDLGGGAAGGGDDRGGLLRWYRGHGAVDRDAGAHRFGPFGGA